MVIELLCAYRAIVDKQTPIQEKQISQMYNTYKILYLALHL